MKYNTIIHAFMAFICSGLLHAINEEGKPAVSINGANVVVNDDDYDANHEWDKFQGPIENGVVNDGLKGGRYNDVYNSEPKLEMFEVVATPVSGKSGELTVNQAGGAVTLWADEYKTKRFYLENIAPSETSVIFWVEGMEPTGSFNGAGFTATYTVDNNTAHAEIRYSITRADINVDSDNNNIIDAQDEKIEFSPLTNFPGKFTPVNLSDNDQDGILDCLEGLGISDVGGNNQDSVKDNLVPIIIKLEQPYDPNKAFVEIRYNDSIPRIGEGISGGSGAAYRISNSGHRIWAVNGSSRHSGKDIPLGDNLSGNDLTNPGNFVPSYVQIPWRALARSTNSSGNSGAISRELTLYVEYVQSDDQTTPFGKSDIICEIHQVQEFNSNLAICQKGYTTENGKLVKLLDDKTSPDGMCVSDIIEPYVEMVRVPDYLFASAKHATPVKFRIKNAGANVYVENVAVEFFASTTAEDTYTTETRFVANDGPEKKNGQANEYTCFIPSNFYSNMNCDEHTSQNPKFKVTARFRSQIDQQTYTKVSIDWMSGKTFADRSINCTDMGLTTKTNIESDTQLVSMPGNADFEVLQSDIFSAPVGSTFVASDHDVFGFERAGDAAYTYVNKTTTQINGEACLNDDADFVSYSANQIYKARAYVMRRGGYMFFSYWGKSHEVLNENEMAMNLDLEDSKCDWELLSNCRSTATCESSTDDPLESSGGVTSSLTSLGWALASGKWQKAFGTITSFILLYAEKDIDSNNASEADIRSMFHRIPRDAGPQPAPQINQILRLNGSGVDLSLTLQSDENIVKNNTPVRVGDEYILTVDVNLAVTAESYITNGNKSKASAKIFTKSSPDPDPEEESPEVDFSKMTIITY